jgi:hypothetical protein
MFIGEQEPESPKITRIVVLDLTEETHGSAVGIGLADYTTNRLVDKTDHFATAINCIAANTPEKGRVPIALKTDREAVEAALESIGPVDPEEARVVHIKNTLEIAEFDVSEALLGEIEGRKNLTTASESGTLSFDSEGKIQPVLFEHR